MDYQRGSKQHLPSLFIPLLPFSPPLSQPTDHHIQHFSPIPAHPAPHLNDMVNHTPIIIRVMRSVFWTKTREEIPPDLGGIGQSYRGCQPVVLALQIPGFLPYQLPSSSQSPPRLQAPALLLSTSPPSPPPLPALPGSRPGPQLVPSPVSD